MSRESISSKTVRTAFWSAIQRFSTMGVQFVVSMTLARLLLPDDYGVIALLNVFLAISNSVAESGFGNALIRKQVCSQEDYSTAFFYNVFVSIVLYMLLFLTAPYIASFYEKEILCPVMRAVGITIVINSFNIIQNAKLTRNLDFKTFAIISFIASFFSGMIGILCAFLGLGVWALVVSSIVSSVVTTFSLVYKLKWYPSLTISKTSFRYLWGFGSKMLLTGIISSIYANIYSIIIGKVYDSKTLGVYNRGQSLAVLCPDIINSIFNRNTLPILSQLQHDKVRLVDVYRKLVRLVSFFNIPVCLIFAALAHPFVMFFLTEKWIDSVIYVQLFCLSSITSAAGVINLNIFQAEGRSDITLKIEVIKKLLGFMMVLCMMFLGPIALAIGSVIFNFFCYSINLYYASKLENMTLSMQLMDLIPSFFASLCAAGGTFLITILPIGYFSQLLIGGFLGGLIYFFITRYIMHLDIYNYIDGYIKNIRIIKNGQK